MMIILSQSHNKNVTSKFRTYVNHNRYARWCINQLYIILKYILKMVGRIIRADTHLKTTGPFTMLFTYFSDKRLNGVIIV